MYQENVSVVIPVFNEEGNVTPLLDELFLILSNHFIEFEVIVVDDGSKDQTKSELKNYHSVKLKTVFLGQNSGQSAALFEGINEARYDIIVLMDGDLQYDPADIPKLYLQLKTGARLVSGFRNKRNDKWLYRMISLVGNSFIKLIFRHKLTDIGCGLKITYKENLNQMTYFRNIHRYIGVLYCLNGLQVVEMEINHRKRNQGRSKYSVWKVFRILKELVFIKMNFKRLKV
ncbi:MAG: glycosyltransferase [Flavobacteriales bacterium]|nr:glycosyltransferase [Flavobacteriales bacterium]